MNISNKMADRRANSRAPRRPAQRHDPAAPRLTGCEPRESNYIIITSSTAPANSVVGPADTATDGRLTIKIGRATNLKQQQRTPAQRTSPTTTAAQIISSKQPRITSRPSCGRSIFISWCSAGVALLALVCCCCWPLTLINGSSSSSSSSSSSTSSERMVRLCIASVDPAKLSSQCVMCNRREFPLTVIDCTGITKVNDLIANPLSVQEATCLIYNCRRQVPDVKPEVYHGSVSNAVNYRGGGGNNGAALAAGASGVSNYQHPGMLGVQQHHQQSSIGSLVSQGAGSSIYETMTPSGIFGGGYAVAPSVQHDQLQQQQFMSPASPYMTRLGLAGYGASPSPATSMLAPLASLVPRGLIGGPSLGPLPMRQQHQQALPYALVPAPGFPFGSRKYKAALVPLFK